ncbi:uncharacterized protein LOC126824957 [Patella vulgata]|uniref:uncharacterized protein LOC126824957 n=1 Tax=Patella vulgata TaxID=6465 RepID=UPI00217F39D5|nr:uncharacterized protein LOC126824957 [Patella vulgata]
MEAKTEVVVYNSEKPSIQTAISAVDLSKKLQKSMLRLKGEFMSEDGKGVAYPKLKTSPLFKEYKEDACLLQTIDLNTLSEDEKIPFFINIYNALTIHSLAEQKELPDSVLKMYQFWRTAAYNIGGHVYTLDDIEHGILRGNRSHPASNQPLFSEKDPRLKFAVKKVDPRIHFALVCGAKSCPAINVYSPANKDHALDEATRNFCRQEVSMFTESDEIWLSKIFQWYRQDFGETDTDVIRWTIPYLDANQQDRANLLLLKLEKIGQVDIKYNEYDWSLNKS